MLLLFLTKLIYDAFCSQLKDVCLHPIAKKYLHPELKLLSTYTCLLQTPKF